MRTELTWSTARTLSQVGELTAQWLEGKVTHHSGFGHPATGGGPDPETAPLVPALAAINRAGLVTDFSQPGHPERDGMLQRAAMCGFCTESTVERLATVTGPTDLVMLQEYSDSGVRVPVTLAYGEQHTWIGGALTPDYLALCYAGLDPAAVLVLQQSWYVSILDPIWGRHDLLWPRLLDALTGG